MAQNGRPRRENCRLCGGHISVVGKLSKRGKCLPCATQRMTDNLAQLHYHDGPYARRWRGRLLAAFGVVTDTDE